MPVTSMTTMHFQSKIGQHYIVDLSSYNWCSIKIDCAESHRAKQIYPCLTNGFLPKIDIDDHTKFTFSNSPKIVFVVWPLAIFFMVT